MSNLLIWLSVFAVTAAIVLIGCWSILGDTWMLIVGVVTIVVTITNVALASAYGHPMPKRTAAAELYFAHRCSNDNPRACIHRAAIHWGISARDGYCVASRETGPRNCHTMNPTICNSQHSGACGLFQFMPTTYAHWVGARACGSLFLAKCSALAWAWYWSGQDAQGRHPWDASA